MTKQDTLVKQRSARPARKVAGAGAGASLATVLVGLVAVFWPEYYARIPDGFEAALGGLMATLGAIVFGYQLRERA